jgi:hypothetical protein
MIFITARFRIASFTIPQDDWSELGEMAVRR